MRQKNSLSLGELSTTKILKLLEKEIWTTPAQGVTSASTNNVSIEGKLTSYDNTEDINAFVDIQFGSEVKTILDVGGGKYDHASSYLREERDISLLVWDPFNRPPEHNQKVQLAVMKAQVDAATSMSVLNVIPNLYSRLVHINTLKAALKLNGKAYFKVWPGDGTSVPQITSISYQANAPAIQFFGEVEVVFGKGNVQMGDVPNLIVAIKKTEGCTSFLEKGMQRSAQKEMIDRRDLSLRFFNKTKFTAKTPKERNFPISNT